MRLRFDGLVMLLGGGCLLALGCVPKGGAGSEGSTLKLTPEEAAKPCGKEATICDAEDNNNQAIVQDGRSGYP